MSVQDPVKNILLNQSHISVSVSYDARNDEIVGAKYSYRTRGCMQHIDMEQAEDKIRERFTRVIDSALGADWNDNKQMAATPRYADNELEVLSVARKKFGL